MAKRKKKISAKAIVMGIVLACVLCLVAVIVLTCNNGVITSDKAFEVVLNDLGITESQAGSPHIHEGTYENKPCYNVYVTVDGKSLSYVISTKGEILHKGEGSHSH